MIFIFTGFSQANSIRKFAFDCVADDRSRTQITIGADLSLARKHAILMQDLPLLCRRLLETKEAEPSAPVMFTEENMVEAQVTARNLKSEKRAARAGTPSPKVGHAWRSNRSLQS